MKYALRDYLAVHDVTLVDLRLYLGVLCRFVSYGSLGCDLCSQLKSTFPQVYELRMRAAARDSSLKQNCSNPSFMHYTHPTGPVDLHIPTGR